MGQAVRAAGVGGGRLVQVLLVCASAGWCSGLSQGMLAKGLGQEVPHVVE